MAWETLSELPIDPAAARVYEHGWQSWSPSTTYRVDERPIRQVDARRRVISCRPESSPPAEGFQGEGLLAIQSSERGPVHLFGVPDGRGPIPSIRAERRGERLLVSADGPVETREFTGPGGIEGALARWADGVATRSGVSAMRRAPIGWCSWYHYFARVTEADMLENLEAIGRLALPVEVVQLDDGYEAEIGDWLLWSDRFRSVQDLVGRIRAAGLRAGIWVAPFLVGARSRTAAEHPDWLVGEAGRPVDAGYNWGQDLYALDATHPGARAYLTDVFQTMRGWGIDYFKIDFIYAGAISGRRHESLDALDAYRDGVALIRRAIGDAYLLGCGAPILASVGLVDAMRISPDCGPNYEPRDGDLSRPSGHSAIITGVGRAFMQGRFWINDPDCLIVRPAVERREEWAAHVARYGGLRASSDRLADLDEWGLEQTRLLLADSPTAQFIPSS